MSDQNALGINTGAVIHNQTPILFGHIQAVDEHQCASIDFKFAPTKFEHFRQMSLFKKERTVQLVVFLIESPAGNEDSYGHQRFRTLNVSQRFTSPLSYPVRNH